MDQNPKPVEPNIVVGGTSKTRRVSRSITLANMQNKIARLLILFGVPALVVLIVLALLFNPFKAKKKPQPVALACSSQSQASLLSQANDLIAKPDIIKFSQLVSKIQKLPYYKQDPNCLYPIVNYYIEISDSKDASTYLTALEKAYNPKQGLSREFTNQLTITDFKNDITTMQKSQRIDVHLFNNLYAK